MRQPAVVIQNLCKTYDKNNKKALSSLSLTIEAGDFFGLLGPNGAGKSTTLNILSQLILKDSGSISVFGWDIDTHPFEVKNMMGIVPQEFNFNLFETPHQIVSQQGGYYGYCPSELKDWQDYLFEKLGLHPHAHKPSRALSGGMKRRLMVARGLIHRPSLLILDEPTAGVDVQLRHDMWDFLKEINNSGTTIILTSHYLEEIELLCPNVAIIDHGQLIFQSSTKKLLEYVDGGHRYEVEVQKPLTPEAFTEIGLDDHYKLTGPHHVQIVQQGSQDLCQLLAPMSPYNVVSVERLKRSLEDTFLSMINHSSGKNVL